MDPIQGLDNGFPFVPGHGDGDIVFVQIKPLITPPDMVIALKFNLVVGKLNPLIGNHLNYLNCLHVIKNHFKTLSKEL